MYGIDDIKELYILGVCECIVRTHTAPLCKPSTMQIFADAKADCDLQTSLPTLRGYLA